MMTNWYDEVQKYYATLDRYHLGSQLLNTGEWYEFGDIEDRGTPGQGTISISDDDSLAWSFREKTPVYDNEGFLNGYKDLEPMKNINQTPKWFQDIWNTTVRMKNGTIHYFKPIEEIYHIAIETLKYEIKREFKTLLGSVPEFDLYIEEEAGSVELDLPYFEQFTMLEDQQLSILIEVFGENVDNDILLKYFIRKIFDFENDDFKIEYVSSSNPVIRIIRTLK